MRKARNVSHDKETYGQCQRCKRPYPEPCIDLLCGECETRCPVCGASGRGCQNLSGFMLAAQATVFNTCMEKHRAACDELWWFAAMDKANKAADPIIKACRLWCHEHAPESATLMPDDPRCSVKPGEADCEHPGCHKRAYLEY